VQPEKRCDLFLANDTALPKELFSDAELRRALSRLGYESEGITDILEALTANKVSWKQTRDFDESAVAALGYRK